MSAFQRTGRLACATVLSAVAAAGCTSGHSSSAGHSTASGTTGGVSTAGPRPIPSDTSQAPQHSASVAKPPNLAEDGVPVLVSAAALKGGAEYPLKGGIQAGKTLATAVNCQGDGTLRVSLEPAGLSFPLTCSEGNVTPTFNEVQFASTYKEAYFKFTPSPSSDITWSFAAGWDPHPPKRE